MGDAGTMGLLGVPGESDRMLELNISEPLQVGLTPMLQRGRKL